MVAGVVAAVLLVERLPLGDDTVEVMTVAGTVVTVVVGKALAEGVLEGVAESVVEDVIETEVDGKLEAVVEAAAVVEMVVSGIVVVTGEPEGTIVVPLLRAAATATVGRMRRATARILRD